MITDLMNRFGVDRAPAPRNDPRLFERVRCHVLRPFCVLGQRVEPGETVVLERHDALSLRAIGKVEF